MNALPTGTVPAQAIVMPNFYECAHDSAPFGVPVGALGLHLTQPVLFCNPPYGEKSAVADAIQAEPSKFMTVTFRPEADQEWQTLWPTHRAELTRIMVHLGAVDGSGPAFDANGRVHNVPLAQSPKLRDRNPANLHRWWFGGVQVLFTFDGTDTVFALLNLHPNPHTTTQYDVQTAERRL
jgi:hypothetical protein